jgi:hypothetical protein
MLNASNTDFRHFSRNVGIIAIIEWCLVGWAFAAYSGRLFWLPFILILFPGSVIAAAFSELFAVPWWYITGWLDVDYDFRERYGLQVKHPWGLLLLTLFLHAATYIAPIIGVISFVKLLVSWSII